ncbi:NAD(P)H-dependent flavin oxidoreductase [Terriglobus saanensis]|uniref:Propionate 3-nitronate monooxygenase n=1 Tax=Terriglobus saanensis (strain ATCC BAA-1853 / DSM 23119 / SP1PR4) TaxID=401053 RepID=E8V7D1_TERSS|nr:nitronate monooxygenase [Terriglobus saanensis]ADV82844.1 2-nitropropane dioxygenase [Terriglobus saanensis SP1PR4]
MRANGNVKNSWRDTRAAQLLGIKFPILQAPFGGFPSQPLTATVSNLGGLGSLGAVMLGGSAIQEAVGELHTLTDAPFAINLWVSNSDLATTQINAETIEQRIRAFAQYYAELGIEPPLTVEAKVQKFETQVRAVIDARTPILSFIYGIPPLEILEECRKQEIKTIGTATTSEEAIALEQAGLDLIVASGFEGGGHRASFLRPAAESLMGGLSLIPQVVDAVQIPVIAAGGISDGRGLVAAMVLGAEAVQVGTAFLICAGSGANKTYRAALQSEAGRHTQLTDAFTGRLSRGIQNSLMDRLGESSTPPLPFPLQHALIQTLTGPASAQAKADWMTIWAGQSAALCQYSEAGKVMAEMIATADSFFS